MPREPGYGSKRSQDGEAPRTCSERQAGCLTRTSGDGAPAAPSPPNVRLSVPGSPEPRYTNASAISAGAGPYLSGAMVKLARPWLTLRTAAE